MEDQKQQQNPQPQEPKTKEKTNYKKLTILIGIAVLIVGGIAWQFLSNSPLNPFSQNNNVVSSLHNLSPSDPIVRVNGEEILKSQLDRVESQLLAQQGINPATLDESMQQQLINQALNAVVAQALLRQQVEKANITVSQEDIDNQLAIVKEGYTDEASYAAALSQQGMTEEQFREQISSDLRTKQYLNQNLNLDSLTATEEEINDAYAQLEQSGEDQLQPLDEIRPQVEQAIINQKQQELVASHIKQLQESAEIELLI